MGLAQKYVEEAENSILGLENEYQQKVQAALKECEQKAAGNWMDNLDLVLVKASEHPVMDPRLLPGNSYSINEGNALTFFTSSVKEAAEGYIVCRYPEDTEDPERREFRFPSHREKKIQPLPGLAYLNDQGEAEWKAIDQDVMLGIYGKTTTDVFYAMYGRSTFGALTKLIRA